MKSRPTWPFAEICWMRWKKNCGLVYVNENKYSQRFRRGIDELKLLIVPPICSIKNG
ncbi:hypothetical protein PGB90_006076 [Kerria lacca]